MPPKYPLAAIDTYAHDPSPWAILLCKFADSPDDPPVPRTLFENFFTGAGAGTWNAPRFFADVSHGLLDLNGSQIIGWFTVPVLLNELVAPGDPPPPGWTPKYSRDQVYVKAWDVAQASGVDLTKFYGVLICFNMPVGVAQGGFFSRGPGVFADFRYVQDSGMSAFGQEMGHAYGLQHSRRDGSTDDYQDPWDAMSTFDGCAMAKDSDYGSRGPGLNAANMRSQGWLNEDRLWQGSPKGFDEVVTLRPLYRRDLPGLLAAEFPPVEQGLIVEYRQKEGWDAAIPRSAVFVHRFIGGHSYLMSGKTGTQDLITGDVFEDPSVFGPGARVEVLDINEQGSAATLRLGFSLGMQVPQSLPGRVIGPVAADGGGIVIIGERVVPVPPWNPMVRILATIEEWCLADQVPDTRTRKAVQRDALSRAERQIARMRKEVEMLGVPAPYRQTGTAEPGTRRRIGRAVPAPARSKKRNRPGKTRKRP